jgi:formylglycine-generating enzyme required for sulfatase activity
MDNAVLDTAAPPPEDERIAKLRAELEGLDLLLLLRALMARFGLSVNQTAVSAGMDESALHKLLDGEHREFKAGHVDALLDDLETLGKLTDPAEKEVWRRALRVAAYLHFDVYKAALPRLNRIEEPMEREKALADYLRVQHPALAEIYDSTGGQFPVVIPFVDVLARRMLKQWDWIKTPEGYELLDGTEDVYFVAKREASASPPDLGPEYDVMHKGSNLYRVRRRAPAEPATVRGPEPGQPKAEAPPDRIPERRTSRFIEPELIRIPAGEFWMGSEEWDKEAWDDEKPRHQVYLPEYWLARYPVTNEEYQLFLSANPLHKAPHGWTGYNFPLGEARHPVVKVKWHDALAYCRWLSNVTGKSYTLPSEAEWEKAARGPSTGSGGGRKYPWGNDWDASRCNTSESKNGGTTPVGQYSPRGDSPYGLADMAGNVWEWTRSLWGKDKLEFKYPYDPKDKRREDLNASNDVGRVVRGGSWLDYAGVARCACRSRDVPVYFNTYIGFRLLSPVSDISGF